MSHHLHLAGDEPVLRPDGARLLSGTAVLPFLGSTSLTGVDREDLAAHRARVGLRRSCRPGTGVDLIGTLDQVALTGRGGGHFPVAAKWRSVQRHGSGATVVANGAEGEPGCAKDAVLLQTRPHTVLDGLAAAAEQLDAADAVVWLHDGDTATIRSVAHALAERVAAREPDPAVHVLLAPPRYLSGEATGIIRTLEGGPTLPRWVPDPAQPWSDGHRPVLVNNAESMARAGLLAQVGASAYEPTSLLTVVNDGYRVVVEATARHTFGDVVDHLWRSPDGRPPQAVLLGGYGGSWVPWDALRRLPVDDAALRKHRLSLGAGLVAPLPADACGLEQTALLLRWLAGESARQCGPCVFGLPAVSSLVDDLVRGRLSRSGRSTLHRCVGEISGRGACRHPDGALRMLTSALETFHHDVHHHRRGRSCDAGRHVVLPLPQEAA